MRRPTYRPMALGLVLALTVSACGAGEGGATSWEYQPAEVSFPITSPPPTSDPPTDPSQPEPQVILSSVFVDAIEVDPNSGSVVVSVDGHLPTPCHRFQWEVRNEGGGAIHLDTWSEADGDQICIQVLEPFSATIEIGKLDRGTCTLMLGGQTLGELSAR